MRELPIRRLFVGPRPDPNRILWASYWFRGHNNQRYAELLPRLDRLDGYLLRLSGRRLIRGAQFRTLSALHPHYHAVLLGAAGRRYGSLFTADRDQIAYFPGPVVADVDDPKHTDREVELLKRPNLEAYVVVTEEIARRFREAGVDKPHYVIPHGVSLRSLRAEDVEAVRQRLRRPGDLVVGYMTSWLVTEGDRRADSPLFNIDHLLELWEEIHRRVPNARLWLLGGASRRVLERCAARDDILCLGRIPRDRVLPHVANFDVALYPRTVDHGTGGTAKVIEYMGAGVPTVSYDLPITREVRDSGAGVLVDTERQFVEAVESLGRDETLRRRLAQGAREAGAERDYDILAARYADILDRHL